MRFLGRNFLLAVLSSAFIGSSCATAPKSDDKSEVQVSAKDITPIVIVPFTSATQLTGYQHQNRSYHVQWVSCSPKDAPSPKYVALSHRFDAGFDESALCGGWIAQTFIAQGYGVIGVNRPSYGKSTGADDLSGQQSIAAIHAALKAGSYPVVGIWGFGTGTIAATFLAKNHPSIQWMILGGGVYDLEITHKQSNHEAFKAAVDQIKKLEGDIAYEKRSIAWDFAGIPKMIGVYHAKDDAAAPHSQANAFNDQLRASEYKVFWTEVTAGGHDLPWRSHMQILTKILKQVAPSESTKTAK
jgi:hypothetical protein